MNIKKLMKNVEKNVDAMAGKEAEEFIMGHINSRWYTCNCGEETKTKPDDASHMVCPNCRAMGQWS